MFTRTYSLATHTIGDSPPNSAAHPEVLALNLSFLPDFFFQSSSTHNNLPREPEPQPSGCPSSLFYHRLSLEILLVEGSSSSNSSRPFPFLYILGAPHHLSLSFPSFLCLVAPDQPPSINPISSPATSRSVSQAHVLSIRKDRSLTPALDCPRPSSFLAGFKRSCFPSVDLPKSTRPIFSLSLTKDLSLEQHQALLSLKTHKVHFFIYRCAILG